MLQKDIKFSIGKLHYTAKSEKFLVKHVRFLNLNRALLVTLCWVWYLWTQDYAEAIPRHTFCKLLAWNYSVHREPFLFVGLCITVFLIYRRIIVHHCVGSSLIHCHACMGMQNNTQEVTPAHLSQSVATYLLYDTICTLHLENFSELTSSLIF
jgi:hypothetical protein